MAYAAPLLRTQTTPVFQNPPMPGVPANPSARASQLAPPSASFNSPALSPTPTLASQKQTQGVVGGPLVTTNIINQKADASRSLYQMCVSLIQRLALVPAFEEYSYSLDPMEPVDTLWALFRTGYPFLTIYDALQPAEPIQLEESKATEAKKAQKIVFKFIQSSSKELNLSPTDSFILRDLTDNDTTGFVKVILFVNRVLDLAEHRGGLMQPVPQGESVTGPSTDQKMSQRDYVVRELVDTERKYVQDLENLHDLKKTLEQKGTVPGDVIHQIFLNINAILDFQRRFLIRIEATNSMPLQQQQWGSAFVTYEDSFDIYHPFIANQRKASETATREFDKIRLADHPVAADINTLDGFLLKPMQRLTKYPLLLKTLLKSLDDESLKSELAPGAEAAERVLSSANEAVNRGMLDEALNELVARVDDWKNHRVEHFGKLMMHGVYGVVTGKSDSEKDYEIFLFESILLCCKEVLPNKSKEKKDRTKSTGPKVRNKNAKLQLKGRIFMTNVTDVVSLSKPGSYSVQIWWKGDPGIENFTIRFPTEEMMRNWASALDIQRKENSPRSSQATENQTEFPWIRAQSNMENPYAQQEEEEEEDPNHGSTPQQYPPPASLTGSTVSRNGSMTSLRQRSMTNESTQSLAGMVRGPPTRFPVPSPAPLSLQTHNVTGAGGTAVATAAAASPGVRNGDSYFSPTMESPPSSRTASGMFPTPSSSYTFPRVAASFEDNNRYTAPALPRAPSREGPSPPAQYGMNGNRNPRGPSLPPPHPPSAAQLQRSRSYSTADINGMPAPRRNTQGAPPPQPQPGVPAVPGIPSYLHNDIPRSQTASPRSELLLPVRTNTQSPGAPRERHHQPSGSLGGAMSQFPSQPVRQHTPNPQQLTVESTMNRTASPAAYGGAHQADAPMPSQLKVKVTCDSGTYFMLVAAFNISYQSLIDRIDVKLARFTNASLGRGSLKLRYQDEDGDLVTIQSDDDIQIAFIEWKDNLRGMGPGDVGEIQLYCVGEGA